MDEKRLQEREDRLEKRLLELKKLEAEIKKKEKAIKAAEGAKKQLLLRLSSTLWEDISKWADDDFRSINGGSSTIIPIDFSIPSDITTGVWNVYLKVCNQLNCDYAVQFANNNIYNSNIKANYVGKVTVENHSSSNVVFKQVGLENAPDGAMHTIENQQSEEPEELRIRRCA